MKKTQTQPIEAEAKPKTYRLTPPAPTKTQPIELDWLRKRPEPRSPFSRYVE